MNQEVQKDKLEPTIRPDILLLWTLLEGIVLYIPVFLLGKWIAILFSVHTLQRFDFGVLGIIIFLAGVYILWLSLLAQSMQTRNRKRDVLFFGLLIYFIFPVLVFIDSFSIAGREAFTVPVVFALQAIVILSFDCSLKKILKKIYLRKRIRT